MRKKARLTRFFVIALLIGSNLILISCNDQVALVTPFPPSPPITASSYPSSSETITAPTVLSRTPFASYTPSPTLLPTLEESIVEPYLIDLIQNPKTCLLPCWWGMTPGVSSWQAVKNFMFHIGFENLTASGNYDEYDRLDFNDLQLYQIFTVNQQSDIVSQITFTVEGFYNPQGFNTVWHSYSPEQILARYGKPSKVTIYYVLVNAGAPGTNNKIGYELWLYYEKNGFLIVYEGLGIYQITTIHICPEFNHTENSWTVSFYLQDPKLSTPLEQMVPGHEGFISNSFSVMDATGLSMDQFMGLSQGKLTCFDILMKK